MSLDKFGGIGHLWARGFGAAWRAFLDPPVNSAHQPDWATMSRVARPSPALLGTAAILLGTAFMAIPLTAEILPGGTAPTAQSNEAPKGEAKSEARRAETAKSEPGRSEINKSESGKNETGKNEGGKNESGKSDREPKPEGKTEGKAEGKADASKSEPGAPHPDESAETTRQIGAAGRGECQWIGQRIVGLLWKDDLDTAFRHLELYDRFGCPGEHLQLSFRCLTRQGDIQKNPKEQNVFDNRVEACWLNPAAPAPPPPPPAAAAEKPAPK